MDERYDTTMLTRALLVVAAVALLAFPVRHVFGEPGLQVLLLAALAVVAALAWAELTGRPVPGLPRLRLPWEAPAPVPAVVPQDVWRSERWIEEAVARGVRALEEWRLDQREA